MTNLTPERRRFVRNMAETQIGVTGEPDSLATLSPEQIRVILHELHVHQIELETQNEELLRAQLELDATRARYFDLYDLAPVGYCTVSAQGLLLQSNLTAARLLGMGRKAVLMRPIIRFVLPADRGLYFQHLRDLMQAGEPQACELRLVKTDGTTLWVHLVSTLAQDDQGGPEHRLMLIDVSYRKQSEAAVQAKNVELEEAKRVADKANHAKSDFLSSMSHELRTPLNSILGFAQLLEAGSPPLTTNQQSRIDQVLKSGWYLLDLVNEILDLAVIESGNVPLAIEPVSLAAVVLECQSMIDPLAQKNAITMHYPTFDLPHWVHADQRHLKQILINLLSNAIKYNRNGGSVELSCAQQPNGRTRVNVRDTGEGLTPDKLNQLFQPFNRLGQEAGTVKGTGIGLVVSKRLVTLMGGDMGAHSTLGVGSVFWFELDSAAAPTAWSHAGTPVGVALEHSPALADAAPSPQFTLLYVEDNLANQELVKGMMARRSDIHLLTAHDALSGIVLARTQHPDLILMDINLPGMSGLEALKVLQQDPLTQHILVLALSANAMSGDIEKGLAAGFFRYVTKPIKMVAFMQVLDLALAHVQEQERVQAQAHAK